MGLSSLAWYPNDMGDDRESRKAPRVGVMRPVEVGSGSATVEATSLDVSESGLAIWGPDMAPRETVELKLDLDDGEPMTVRGVVVREFVSDGGSVWGIEFRGLDEATRGRLRRFVAARH